PGGPANATLDGPASSAPSLRCETRPTFGHNGRSLPHAPRCARPRLLASVLAPAPRVPEFEGSRTRSAYPVLTARGARRAPSPQCHGITGRSAILAAGSGKGKGIRGRGDAGCRRFLAVNSLMRPPPIRDNFRAQPHRRPRPRAVHPRRPTHGGDKPRRSRNGKSTEVDNGQRLLCLAYYLDLLRHVAAGDPRGHVSNILLPEGGFERKRNTPGRPVMPGDAYTQDRARALQKYETVWLTQEQALIAAHALIDAARARGWRILRAAIMANHVHVVITDCPADGPAARRVLNGNR